MNDLQFQEGRKKDLLNLPKWLLVYLICTVVLYLFGPVEWKTHNSVVTFALIFLYYLALKIGFSAGKRRYRPANSTECVQPLEERFIFRHFYLVSALYIVLKLIAIERIVRLFGYANMFTIVENVFNGTYSDLYTAEKLVSGGGALYGGKLFTFCSLLLSPLSYCYIPTTLVFWKKLNLCQKFLGLVCVALWIIHQLGCGTSKGFFVIIMTIFVAFLLRDGRKKKKPRTKAQFFILILCIALLLVAFNFVMTDRMKDSVNFNQRGENQITESGLLYNYMPKGYKNLLVWADFYICQGYYGLSLATTVGWYPTFGAGFSRWLCLELSSLISPQIYLNTYQMRIQEQYRWDASANWHTAFSWFANDVGLIGVIGVMFLLGLLFVYVYYDAYDQKRSTDIGLLCLLVQMIFFLPCNNVIFSDSFTLVPFFVYLILYVLQRKGIRFKLRSDNR